MLVSGAQQSVPVIFLRFFSIINYYKVLNIIPCDIIYMWNLKIIQVNLYTKQIHRHRKQTYGYQGEREGGRDELGVWD